MYCESFRRILKIVYLDSKQNRRVDRLLAVLLLFAKDKAFKRIQKLKKGKSSHRMKEILKRHKTALEMVSDGAVPRQESENSWQVHSQSSEQVYTATGVKQECSCLLHCVDCHACIQCSPVLVQMHTYKYRMQALACSAAFPPQKIC